MATPEEQAIAQAEMNQWAARANEVAARMQEHGLLLSVNTTRARDIHGNLGIDIKLGIDVTTHIRMFELMCDKLDEEEEG